MGKRAREGEEVKQRYNFRQKSHKGELKLDPIGNSGA